MRRLPAFISLVLLTVAVSFPARAQFEDVTIEATAVRGPVYMLEGRGGNLGVLTGPQGVLLVDDQYRPLTPKIRAAIARLDDGPIRFVLNTHWHIDHTEGNGDLAAAGAVVVAHDNVRIRMGSEQYMPGIDRTFPPSPPVSLPVVTFNDRLTFHFNGEEIAVYHVERAHTDGDAIVHFRDSNVLHMGDNFFSGMYPLVDRSSGGSVLGMIAAVQFALEFCDGETRVIPGHGEPGNCADLETFGQMLADTTDRVRELMTQGKTLAEAIAARPSAAWDEELGGGFIKPDRFVEFIYKSLLDEEA